MTVTRTVVEKVQVPDRLLAPCAEPNLDEVETTGDLERVAQEGIAGTACGNADKEAIREWQAEEIDQ